MSDPEYNPNPFPAGLDIAAVVAAFIPFVCSFSSSSTTTVNGEVVEESNFDLVPAIGGAIAIILGLAILMTLILNTPEVDRFKRYGVVALTILVGVFQVVRGLDLV